MCGHISHIGTQLLLHGQGLQTTSPAKDGGAYIPVLIINTTLPGIVEAFFAGWSMLILTHNKDQNLSSSV